MQLVETTVLTELGPRPSVAKHLKPVDNLLQHAKVSWPTYGATIIDLQLVTVTVVLTALSMAVVLVQAPGALFRHWHHAVFDC